MIFLNDHGRIASYLSRSGNSNLAIYLAFLHGRGLTQHDIPAPCTLP